MNPRSRTNWTREDEQRFQEMSKQRDEILTKNRKPIADIVNDLFAFASKQTDKFQQETVVEFFEQNAERIRDALDPYDSHERAAQAPLPAAISVAPAKRTGPKREDFIAAISEVKAQYDVAFARVILDIFGGRGKKLYQVDESRWQLIIEVCTDIIDYKKSYPMLHEEQPGTWNEAMKNLINRYVQRAAVGDILTVFKREFDEFVISTEGESEMMIKNFGDL